MQIITVDSAGAYKLMREGKLDNGEIFEIRYLKMNGFGVFIQGQMYSAVVPLGCENYKDRFDGCQHRIQATINAKLPNSEYADAK